MSCHDIGRAMNDIIMTIIDMYEDNLIEKDPAIKLIYTCRKGVNWCDGNEYEAIEDIVKSGYCGLCFEKTGDLTSVFENDLGYPECYKVYESYDDAAAHYYLCPKCKEKVLKEYKEKHAE